MYNLDKRSDKGKIIDYLNEILAAENAITERLHKRINETTINELKNLFTNELGERKNHQNTLRNIISAYGGIPTHSKAYLLSLEPSNGKEIDITKDNIESDKTIKSVLSKDEGRRDDNDLGISSSESEILRMKEDAMIKNAEMLGYKMALNIAQKANAKDAITALRNNLQEKVSSYNSLINLASPLIDNLEDSNNISNYGKNKAGDDDNNHYRNKPQYEKSYQLGYEIANILTSAWNTKENPNKVYIFNRRVHHGAIGALLGLSSLYKKQPIVTSMLSGIGAGLARDDYDDFKEWFLFKKKVNEKE
jgi:ferritin-like metal-binding protein YciE